MDRRMFVEAVGAAAYASRFPHPASRLGTIGLQLYTVRGEMAKDVAGTLAKVRAIGYREVEFAGYFNKTPAQMRALLDRHDLVAPSAHIPIELLTHNWAQALEEAHILGHQYLLVAWVNEDMRRTIDGYKRVAELFNRAGEEAHAHGIRFGYHNHSYEFERIDGQLPYDVILDATEPRHVALEMDLYWITRGGQNPLDYFARYPRRFELVHLKDAGPAPEYQMKDVGAGTIDWKRIFAQRTKAGIRHYFVEHDEPADPFASIRASYEYLRRLEF